MNGVVVGVWACLMTIAAGFGAAQWWSDLPAAREEPYLEGLEYTRLPTISVPMISDGQITGYVVIRLVYTADAGVLNALSIPPDAFVVDEAFREIYTNGRVEFGQIGKYQLNEMIRRIVDAVNARLEADVVRDLLIEGLNYVDRTLPPPSEAPA